MHELLVLCKPLTIFLGFSPDPVLSGIAVAETIQGMQSSGIMACTKHYILNEQEHFRQVISTQSLYIADTRH